jgi:epoxyqueuosine reductase QueG
MTRPTDTSDRLRELLAGKGACLVGFADLSSLDVSCRAGLPNAVSIAVALGGSVIKGIEDGPTREYHREYDRAKRLLSILADEATDLLRERGSRAEPMKPTTREVDPVMGGTLLPHKTVATLAGLGWVGKCALLITEDYGSAIRLTSVLTDAVLETGLPVTESRCGDCTECMDLCPAGAPTGRHWESGIERELIYDAYACRDKARELSAGKGIDETICGICIAACPWTRKHLKRAAGS